MLQNTITYFGETYNVEIEPKKSIRIYGNYKGNNKAFNITFKIGDKAEYDSYNLKYIGEIVSIGEKTVTIDPGHRDKKSRLSLAEFCWRNHNFDAERIAKENAIESLYI